MRFTLTRASDFYGEPKEIKIATIMDLKRIVEKEKLQRLVIDFDIKEIIIYDDWIE